MNFHCVPPRTLLFTSIAAPSAILSKQTSRGFQLLTPPDLPLFGQEPRMQKRHPLGAKGVGTFGRLCVLFMSRPCWVGTSFSDHVSDGVQSAPYSLSWLPAIDHQQGTPWLLNKRGGLYAKGALSASVGEQRSITGLWKRAKRELAGGVWTEEMLQGSIYYTATVQHVTETRH